MVAVALEQWPGSGIPDNPGAWLMATAKHHAIDQLRHRKLMGRKHEQLGHEAELQQEMAEDEFEAAADDELGDDLLRLIFTACHPVLATEARVALTLRLLCGLTTGEIARAFLAPEATVAQRIVRAKRTLAEARVPFEVPRGAELNPRLSSVLEVIYLVFNEGYSATAGDDWLPGRPSVRTPCVSAVSWRSSRPWNRSLHGLVALMEIQACACSVRAPAPAANRCCSWIRIGRAGIGCWCTAVSRRSTRA